MILVAGADGIVNGAVYGLMAPALILVFPVTRVIIPQGEFVAFGALTVVGAGWAHARHAGCCWHWRYGAGLGWRWKKARA